MSTMTDQHGPEADAWMVELASCYELALDEEDAKAAKARLEAEMQDPDCATISPLYAVRPKRLEWEGGFAKTHFGIYIVGYWPSLPPDKRYSMQRPGDVEYADFTTESEAKSAAQADYDRRAWACFESV